MKTGTCPKCASTETTRVPSEFGSPVGIATGWTHLSAVPVTYHDHVDAGEEVCDGGLEHYRPLHQASRRAVERIQQSGELLMWSGQ